METTTCRTDGGAPQAGDVINPLIEFYAPKKIYKDPQWLQLKKNCPHLNFTDRNNAFCCNDDQAEILGNAIL